jgi:hypothetical protein
MQTLCWPYVDPMPVIYELITVSNDFSVLEKRGFFNHLQANQNQNILLIFSENNSCQMQILDLFSPRSCATTA